MFESLNTPFFHGLAIGLAVGMLLAGWSWIAGWMRRRELRKETADRLQAVNEEMGKLRDHLHTQMQITAKGADDLQKQLADMRGQNENLRILVQGLQQKPERAQLRTLEIWQRAIDRMSGRAPGFAAAWQQAVAEAEGEMAEAEHGLTKFVRRFLGSGKSSAATPNVPQDSAPKEDPPEA